MIDPAAIGQLAMRLLDHIESEYGEDATLEGVVLAVELKYPHPEQEGKTQTTIQWDDTWHSQSSLVGMLIQMIAGSLMRGRAE